MQFRSTVGIGLRVAEQRPIKDSKTIILCVQDQGVL